MAGRGRRRAKALADGGPCLALPALLLLAALAAAGTARQPLSFPQPINNLAVSGGRVLVASGPCVYVLGETRLAPAAATQPPLSRLYCVNRNDAVNKILLPYAEEEGGRLITCWTQPDGICYRGSLHGPYPKGAMPPENKIMDQFISCSPNDSSVGKMFYRRPDWFLVVVAAATALKGARDNCTNEDTDNLYILGENDTRVGEKNRLDVPKNHYFMDIFLWGGHLFFPCYHVSDRSIAPKMLIIPQVYQKLQYSQTALQCANKSRILSSSQLSLPGDRAFWIGIFTSGEEPTTPTSTALCLFDLKQVLKDAKDCHFSPEFSRETPTCNNTRHPVNKSPFLNHSNLVSVYATVILKTPVLFLGTKDGQLLKVTLDEKMRPSCPDVLYENEEETEVFYKLEFDPLDNNFIYLPSNKNLNRVQVANCSKYISCKECLSAMDPYCGWCHFNKRCTLKEDCSNNSGNWVDISKGADKCLKIHISGTYRGYCDFNWKFFRPF